MTELDIQEQLDQRYPTEHFDVVLKCWQLVYAPIGCYYNHCGEHTEITRASIKSPGFQKLMDECRDEAFSRWASGQTTIRVMCICGQGRHRSVAVSSILKAVYLKMGFNSRGPTHLSKEDWWPGMCHTCEHCKPNAYKEAMTTALAHQLSG